MTIKNLIITTCIILASSIAAAQHNIPVPQIDISLPGHGENLVGTLEMLVGDPPPGSGQSAEYRFYLRADNGRSYELSFDPGLMRRRAEMVRWVGEQVKISTPNPGQILETVKPDQKLAVSTVTLIAAESKTSKTKDRQAIQAPQSGSKPWVTVFCKFADIETVPSTDTFYENMYSNSPGGLDHYWRENSYESMNIQGSSSSIKWVDLPGTLESYMTEETEIDGVITPSPDLGVLFDDCIGATDEFVDFSNGGAGFYGVNMMFNATMGCCAWGGERTRTLDGVTKSWGVTWLPPWAHKHSVLAHEMGHAFGLPHSNNWDDDDYPYDNPWDVMSMSGSTNTVIDPVHGQLGPHTNAYHKFDLGWISGDRVLTVSPKTTISTTLDAMTEQNSTNHRMVLIEVNDNTFFTVEARKRTGSYDQTLPDDAVIIYEVDKGRSEPSWAVDSDIPPADTGSNEGTMWRVGETFENSTGEIFVTIEAETTTGFEVTIEHRGITTSAPEVAALTELYNSTGGDNWTDNSNWLVGDPCADSWFGVVCGVGTVHRLILADNNLIGSIPASINSLVNLKRFSLASNQLTGSIPASLGDLVNLTFLDFSNNQLSDSLPDALTNLINLTWLDLSDNQLAGSIPSDLDKLIDLYGLFLSNNQLTGSIPAGLGNLPKLNYLHLNTNELNGTIPETLGSLNKLDNLILYSNRLTGPVPAVLGDLVELRYLYLHNNQLNGPIPTELGKLGELFALSLANNPLGGSLPAELGSLPELEHLYLYNNLLTGSIPAELGNLAILKTLTLANNQLSGTIPVALGSLGMLQSLNLFDNQLSGPIPAELGNMSDLQQLVLQSNQLSGAIPNTISNLSNLNDINGIYLGWNALYTNDPELELFLNIKTGSDGWDSYTQTVAPQRVRVSSMGSGSVVLAWEPIDYIENNGGYRIWYKQSAGGTYLDGGITVDKSSTSHTISGLIPGEAYTFRVTTETSAHANNNNLVVSEPSLKVTAKPSDAAFLMNIGLNDAWYYPITNGQGFFITVFPELGLVSLAWFTYDTERQGEEVTANLGEAGHRWLNAVGAYSGNQAVLDISYATGGLFDTKTDISEVTDGTIILTFTDCENGTVEYDIPSAELQGIVPIRRVVADNIVLCEAFSDQATSQQISAKNKTNTGNILSTDAPEPVTEALPLVDMNVGLNDAWYYPETNGQGFFITVFPEIGYVLLSWFTYDTERPAEGVTANLGEAGHRWFNALGVYSGNSASLDIIIASGGLFDSPNEITEANDGTITLTFTDCHSGTVEYDIPSIDKQGLVPIQRVASDNIAFCESLITE
ncbi:MAG: hypothetical protein GY732_08960 [Gammaproteobacteria bacterium]|nr:hypothetical protein [Gammaproteobacteria bacterium]